MAKLGYKRVILFPYFLFAGVLIDRIYGFTDEAAVKYPEIDFIKAGYLNDHPKVIETFAERVREILDGENNMNCGMCKYRETVLGFEAEQGAVQESHHHHVEGQGANAPGATVENCELCDTFCSGACRLDMNQHHDHDHSHGHDHHHHDHDHAHPRISASRPPPRARICAQTVKIVGYIKDPSAIYAQSFATVRAEADLSALPEDLHPTAIRLIHACGMVDLPRRPSVFNWGLSGGPSGNLEGRAGFV